jgi:hypothetical protein
MSLASSIRRSSFVAVALSLTAFGLTAVPAAAHPFPLKPIVNPLPGPVSPPKPLPIPIVNPPKPLPIPIVNPPKPLPIPIVNPPKPLPGPIVVVPKPIDICVIMPSKCVKPVVVNPVIVAPAPIVVEQAAHVVVRPVAVEAPASTCNCLTKQYQTDGSVLFRDVCTNEAALATPDDLKAQAEAAAQQQTQLAPAH